jgi:hypothetical protein
LRLLLTPEAVAFWEDRVRAVQRPHAWLISAAPPSLQFAALLDTDVHPVTENDVIPPPAVLMPCIVGAYAYVHKQQSIWGEWLLHELKSHYQASIPVQAKQYGPGVSGALFGAGWWFWLDAIGSASVKIPFKQVGPCVVQSYSR